MTNNISGVSNCVGCGACYHACGHNSIAMLADEQGFYYPHISDNCTNCALCLKVCPMFMKDGQNGESEFVQIGMIGKSTDENSRYRSSSGGIFPLLAGSIYEQGGVVYGAGYGENFKVLHKRTVSLFEMDELRGSKYVQSYFSDVYNAVDIDLKEGNFVLVTGTPCQLSSLSRYLFLKKSPMENLYLCDLLCNGTPSPLIWKKYVEFMSEKCGVIKSIHFRDKIFGANHYTMRIDGMKQKYCKSDMEDPFLNLFCKEYGFNKACRKCPFKSRNRVGDISIGDCPNAESLSPSLYDTNGISLIMVNTKKGEELFDKIKEKMAYNKISIDTYSQPNIIADGNKDRLTERDLVFWKEFHEKGFTYILRKYTEEGVKLKIKGKFRRGIKKLLINVGFYEIYKNHKMKI